MYAVEGAGVLGMRHGNGELQKAFGANRSFHVLGDETRLGQFADPKFCRDFPSRNRANEDFLVFGLDCYSSFPGEF